jgi:hypothetical protein
MGNYISSDESSILSPLSQRSWPLLIGRSQGPNIFELLGQELVTYSLTSLDHTLPNTSDLGLERQCIPNSVACQLKYDVTRREIISSLYSRHTRCVHIQDVLCAFVQAASAVAYEPYFADAAPGLDGACLRCSSRLPRYVRDSQSSMIIWDKKLTEQGSRLRTTY